MIHHGPDRHRTQYFHETECLKYMNNDFPTSTTSAPTSATIPSQNIRVNTRTNIIMLFPDHNLCSKISNHMTLANPKYLLPTPQTIFSYIFCPQPYCRQPLSWFIGSHKTLLTDTTTNIQTEFMFTTLSRQNLIHAYLPTQICYSCITKKISSKLYCNGFVRPCQN